MALEEVSDSPFSLNVDIFARYFKIKKIISIINFCKLDLLME